MAAASSEASVDTTAQPTEVPVQPPSPRMSAFSMSDGVIRAIFLLLGVGILLPWNAFVSSKPYFSARLCGEDGEDIVNFEQYFGLIWNTSSVLSLGLIIFGQAIADYCKRKRHQSLDDTSTNPLNLASDSNSPQNSVGSERHSLSSIRSSSKFDHSLYLVMLPLALYMAIFSLQAVMVLIPRMTPEKFLLVTLCGLAVCGTCGAIATAGIVSTAGLFPSHIGINPFFSGQALGGVAVSVANFIAATVEDPGSYFEEHCTTVINGTSEASQSFDGTATSIARADYSAQNFNGDGPNYSCSPYQSMDFAVFSYFVAGCIVLLLCLVGYHLIHNYRMQEFRDDYQVVHDTPLNMPNRPDLDETSPRIGLELNDRVDTRSRENENAVPQSSSLPVGEGIRHLFPDERAVPSTSTSEENLRPRVCGSGELRDGNIDAIDDFEEEYTDEDDEIAVFSAIKGPACCIFLTFTVTLCLFPSWVSELRSTHECKNHVRLVNDLYVPFSFLFFNVGDLLGRIIAERIPVERVRHLSRKLVVGALLRAVFFPLFLFTLSTVGSQSSIVIRSDVYSLTVQFLFAVSNGILVSTSFMWSPHLVGSTSHMQERASEIMTFAVCFGLLSGSLLAFPFLQAATQILH